MSDELSKAGALQMAKRMGATDVDLQHINCCLEPLVLFARGELRRQEMGSFVGSLVDGDFVTVCGAADDTNQKYLPAYACFLYNEMPMDKTRLLQRKAVSA